MHEQQTIVSADTAPVVTITVKDPAALSWEQRAGMRIECAQAIRDWSIREGDPIAVDLMEARDD